MLCVPSLFDLLQPNFSVSTPQMNSFPVNRGVLQMKSFLCFGCYLNDVAAAGEFRWRAYDSKNFYSMLLNAFQSFECLFQYHLASMD
jgi:hypothetical protein